MPDRSPQTPEPSPDELEQRQRLDGTYETDDDRPGEGLDPDVLEQRRRADGSFDRDELDDVTGEPLDPDVIEQRRGVGDDDDDEPGPAEEEG